MRIAIEGRQGRARVDLQAGVLVPRLIRAGPSSAAIAVTAGGALLLDGDHVAADLHVGRGCHLEIEDVGGTVAYGGHGRGSSWTVRIDVDDGGTLVWHTMPLVVSDGAEVTRSTTVRLGDGARVLLRETLVLGRHGEAGGTVRSRTDVVDPQGPILREDLAFRGGRHRPGVLGGHRVFDSAMSLGVRQDPADAVLQLERPGTIARAMGSEAHIASLDPLWRRWTGSSRPDAALMPGGDIGGVGAAPSAPATPRGRRHGVPGVAARSSARNRPASHAS